MLFRSEWRIGALYFAGFLPVAAGKDSAMASQLVTQFLNPDNRQRAVDQAATKIALVDPARAVDWALSYSPPSEDRVKKLEPLVRAWMKADPAGALSIWRMMYSVETASSAFCTTSQQHSG